MPHLWLPLSREKKPSSLAIKPKSEPLKRQYLCRRTSRCMMRRNICHRTRPVCFFYFQQVFYPRGKGLGGSGSINYMSYTRGSRHDFNLWSELGCTGWSYKEVLPYFIKSEDNTNSEYIKSGLWSGFVNNGCIWLNLAELHVQYVNRQYICSRGRCISLQ